MATRWGIASAGLISHDFVTALDTQSSEEHQVMAVAARDLKRAQEFAALHYIPNAYSSYKDLAKNSDIDIVYVGTINPLHFEVTKMMLENGKHVLCEKPFCMNAKEVLTLVKIAKEKKLFLMEGMWSRFFPAYQHVRQELSARTIGDVKQAIVTLCVSLNVDRVKKKELGGGTVLDLGVYVLQFALMIFGHEMPLSVKAVGHLNEGGVDESAAIVLTYPGSKTAVMTTSSIVTAMSNDAVVFGTKGSIKLPDTFWAPTKVVFSNNSTDHKVQTVTEFPLPSTHATHKYNFNNNSGLKYEADEVRRCIREGLIESPLFTHQESITIARLQDMIHEQLGVEFN